MLYYYKNLGIQIQQCTYYITGKIKTNFKNCLFLAAIKRGWIQTDAQDFNMLWIQKQLISQSLSQYHLNQNQKINHFRFYYQLCRKDLLIKNLKITKKTLLKLGKTQEAQKYNFFPLTFNLPSQFSLFIQQFKKNQDNIWIMKPVNKCQGKGIFFVNKLSQILPWKIKFNQHKQKAQNPIEPYIIQKYINSPLLLGGKKFDLRIYVLCTSYSPLTIYLYRSGFARFTHVAYDNSYQNLYSHLTNVAVQQTSEQYDDQKGGKWDLNKIKLYFISKIGKQNVNQIFKQIQNIVIRSLFSVKNLIYNQKHCFQLYGFDILLDSNYKPWLLQVNGGPSLTATTPQDCQLKCGLIDDIFSVVDLQKLYFSFNRLCGDQITIGGFDLIYKKIPVVLCELSQNMSLLGGKVNRKQSIKKLALQKFNNINKTNNQMKKEKKIMSVNNVSQNQQIK